MASEAAADVLEYVRLGDEVFFSWMGDSKGTISGDAALRSVGVAAEDDGPSLFHHQSAFELVPMLSYHAKKELRTRAKEIERNKATSENDDNNEAEEIHELDELRRSADNETAQNKTVEDERRGEVVNYGDVLQLRHRDSNLFLKMRSKRALLDKECKDVRLADGSPSSYFRVSPKFKTRSMGTPVYFGDEIYLTSVKYDLLVHASKQKFYPTASIQNQEILENTDGLGIDLPTSLRRPRVREINGSQDLNSFKINLYDHIDVDDEEDAKSLRSHQMFRLFSPEAESFLQASSDPEKSLHGVREDGFTPSHCLYLKRLGAIDINNTEYLSAKGLFVFESLNRRASSSIKYNEGIRIRHAISSKYLSCERSAQDFSIGLIFDTTGSEQSTIFFVVPAEKTDDSTVPSMVSTIRIEHELEDGRRVHLHSTSLFKSRLASSTKTPRGTSVVFSVEHHSEDMLKLFPASKEESLLIRKLVSKRAILHRCQFAMENCAALPSPHVVEPCIDLVLQLIDDVTRGEGFGQDLYKLTISEWIKKANSMLPTKFSALFSGKAVRHIQNKCVEIKLMETVFDLALAPYNRFNRVDERGQFLREVLDASQTSPWVDSERNTRKIMERTKALQKLLHVALQKIFQANSEAKNYFANRMGRILAPSKEGCVSATSMNWVKIIATQSEDPLGATVTLANLIAENEQLMAKVVDEALLKKLCQLIIDRGPQPRFMKIFESICRTHARPIVANQEQVMRLLWMNEEVREKTLIELIPSVGDKKTIPGPFANSEEEIPSDFLAKTETSNGKILPVIYCDWSGNENWTEFLPELFWSQKSMEIRGEIHGEAVNFKQKGVRLESLCWVLDPKNLCEVVTGKKFVDPKATVESRRSTKSKQSFQGDSKEKFAHHCQLADWFVAQLKLFTAMVSGRSYNVIAHLEKVYTYPVLLSIVFNENLPPVVRSCGLDLVRVLFLDRYPQLKHNGKPMMPQKLWIFEDASSNDQGSNVALIRKKNLKEKDALPGFQLGGNHEFVRGKNRNNRTLAFQDDTKFFLLRKMTNSIIKKLSGQLIHSQVDVNTFLCSNLQVSASLLSFGFQSAYPKLQDLCQVVGTLLDGRHDLAKPKVAFLSQERWKDNGGEFLAVSHLKRTAIHILQGVSDLRADYRLSQLLFLFKSKYMAQLNKHAARPINWSVHPIIGASEETRPAAVTSEDSKKSPKLDAKEIYMDFEKFFEENAIQDAVLLDLSPLTQKPIGDVLRDCLLYEDDDLFASSLNLLDRRFSQRQKLVECLGKVKLLEGPELPVFGSVNACLSKVEYMIYILRSTQQWGVSSRISGEFDRERFECLQQTCAEILRFLTTCGDDDVEQNNRQEILFSLNLTQTLSEGIRIDPNLAFKGSICDDEDKMTSQNMLLKSLLSILSIIQAFVKQNKTNQHEFFHHVNSFSKIANLQLEKCEALPELLAANNAELDAVRASSKACLIQIMNNNSDLARRLASNGYDNVFTIFLAELSSANDPTILAAEIQFFTEFMNPEGSGPIRKNQQFLAKILMRSTFTPFRKALRSAFDSSCSFEQPWNLVNLVTCLVESNGSVAELLGTDFFAFDANDKGVDNGHAITMKIALAILAEEISHFSMDKKSGKYEQKSSDIPMEKVFALAEFTQVLSCCRSIDPDSLLYSDSLWELLNRFCSIMRIYAENYVTPMVPASFIYSVIDIFYNCLTAAATNSLLETIFDERDNTIEELSEAAGLLLNLSEKDTKNPLDFRVISAAYGVLKLLGQDVKKPLNNRVDSTSTSTFGLKSKPHRSKSKWSTIQRSIGLGSIDVEENLAAFKDAVVTNEYIIEKIRHRKFMLVETLESGEYPSWDEVVSRFERYGSANYHKPECAATMIQLLNTLWYSLVKIRSDDGKLLELEDLSDAQQRAFKERQDFMERHGISKLVFNALSHSAPSLDESSVTFSAFRLQNEMLMGGNANVQSQLASNINFLDHEGKFHLHLLQRIIMLRTYLTQRREDKMATNAVQEQGNSNENTSADFQTFLEHGIQTFSLMQQFCKGHNAALQDLLRHQPTHIGNINLLKESIDILYFMCSTSAHVTALESEEVSVVDAILEFFAEACLGPAPNNQDEIVKSDAIVAVKNIINVKGVNTAVLAVKVLCSLFEGRKDTQLAELLATKIEPVGSLLNPLKKELERNVEQMLTSKKKDLDKEENQALVELSTNGMANIRTIFEGLASAKKAGPETKSFQSDISQGIIASVDISWRGHTNKVFFPLPIEKDRLTVEIKNSILHRVDVTMEHDRRMKELFFYSEDLHNDLKIIDRNARAWAFYRFVHENQSLIHNVVYVFVLLLNVNTAIASSKLRKPVEALFLCGPNNEAAGGQRLGVFCEVDKDLQLNLILTFVLGLIALIGYASLIIVHAKTEFPSVVMKANALRETNQKKIAAGDQENQTFTWQPFLAPSVLTILAALLLFEQYAAYHKITSVAIAILSVFLGAWFTKSLRDAIIVPNTKARFYFVCTYDSLIDRRYTRNHLILLGLLVVGFLDSYFFTILLFDIFDISVELQDVLSAITDSLHRLVLILFTIGISLFCFASFGARNFADAFGDDAGDADHPGFDCSSTIKCFSFMAYKAFPYGDLSEIMESTDYDDAEFLPRLLFDLLFFVWIGVLLFNIITGLVLDAFGAKRDASSDRAAVMENQCFVCGITRLAFKDLNLPPGDDSFEDHKNDHHIWNYVFFVHYLQKKSKTDMTGLETYVTNEIDASQYTWLPKGSSNTIERYTQKDDDEESLAEKVSSLSEIVNDMQEFLGNFEEGLSSKLSQLLEKPSKKST